MDGKKKNLKCFACPNLITDRRFIKCSLCKETYDLECANVSEKRFYLMTSENKNSWLCDLCRSRRPKRDNTNTPVRETVRDEQDKNTDGSTEEVSNVTLRTKLKTTCTCISRDDIREIMRSELQIANERLNETNKVQLQEMRELIRDFQESMNFFNKEFHDFKKEYTAQKALVESIKKENEQLKLSNAEMHTKLTMTNKCEPQISKYIACLRTNMKTLRQSFTNWNTRPRNILVKFSNQKRRDDFIKSVIEFNKKKKSEDRLNTSHLGMAGDKTAIFVSEHLSLENKQLHASARIRAKELGYKYVWVRNGKIFIRKSEETSHICVRNLDTLKKML
ncbi:hypothetical protein ACJJTC_009967 [Scirpophaga incertulas]